MKLLYPTSLKINVGLIQDDSVTLHSYNPKEPIPEEHIDAEALVTWANSPDNLSGAAVRMKNLRWIQALAAGPNEILNAGFDMSKVILTTGSGLHDHTVAEHALGLVLNAARRFFEMQQWQLKGAWAGHLGGVQEDRPAGRFTTLRDANILIWGFGNIAKTLAPVLTSLGAKVRGIARSSGVRNGVEVFSEDHLESLLPSTDVLVMILPGSDSTRHILGRDRIAKLPKHAWVTNVGRGTCIDEEALTDALIAGDLGGAALDVFEVEPLPASSRLWKAPNVIISPHAAGGRPQGAETLIAENIKHLKAGEPLRNQLS